MKKELHIFFTAVMFYTRIPVPKGIDHSSEYLRASVRYFSLVGLIVGSVGALVFYLINLILPLNIAVLLSMVATIRLTGAFHEDGFADVCDGFGGGWTKEKIMEIMKDSRLGTFGTVGLVSLLALKFLGIVHFPYLNTIPLLMVTGHSLSRFIAVTTMYTHQYVQEKNQAKAGNAIWKLSTTSLLINAMFALLPFLFFKHWEVLLVILPVYLTKILMTRFYQKWIGGYTGDCVGAIQQVTEVVFYLSMIPLIQFVNL